MPDKKFELGDYIEVKDRIAIFYELYPQGRLVTADVRWPDPEDDAPRIAVRALAYRSPEDTHPGVGWSWMALPGTTPYTRGSELENTETSAWGRAIAALGILIDRSIVTAQEVENKAGGDHAEPVRNGGLIGEIATKGTQDFQLRETPDGWMLPFRVKAGRQSQIVIAQGAIAHALAAVGKVGDRVTVFGSSVDKSFPKGDAFVAYTELHVERIVGPDYTLPSLEADPEPLWDAGSLAEAGVE